MYFNVDKITFLLPELLKDGSPYKRFKLALCKISFTLVTSVVL